MKNNKEFVTCDQCRCRFDGFASIAKRDNYFTPMKIYFCPHCGHELSEKSSRRTGKVEIRRFSMPDKFNVRYLYYVAIKAANGQLLCESRNYKRRSDAVKVAKIVSKAKGYFE